MRSSIEAEGRLNLYKDLQSEVTSEGEAVMQVSNVVKELINIQGVNPNQVGASTIQIILP